MLSRSVETHPSATAYAIGEQHVRRTAEEQPYALARRIVVEASEIVEVIFLDGLSLLTAEAERHVVPHESKEVRVGRTLVGDAHGRLIYRSNRYSW
ncbi:MAG TPA: hypothetical protein VF543_22210 [Pyrinomonadaceae bacterium]